MQSTQVTEYTVPSTQVTEYTTVPSTQHRIHHRTINTGHRIHRAINTGHTVTEHTVSCTQVTEYTVQVQSVQATEYTVKILHNALRFSTMVTTIDSDIRDESHIVCVMQVRELEVELEQVRLEADQLRGQYREVEIR